MLLIEVNYWVNPGLFNSLDGPTFINIIISNNKEEKFVYFI